jgi:hypothetical protein
MPSGTVAVVSLLVLSFSTGCGGDPLAGSAAKDAVTLVVPLEAGLFDADATLQVRLWNAEQLATLEKNARCAVTRGPDGQAAAVHCPAGVEYKEVTPEQFSFTVRDLGEHVDVTSDRIRVGEAFKLLVSGLSRDRCNTTSADFAGSAGARRVVLERLPWQTTAKACLNQSARALMKQDGREIRPLPPGADAPPPDTTGRRSKDFWTCA